MEDDFVTRCERLVGEQAKEALSDGRAKLERIGHGPGDWFNLTPTRERACPMSLTPNGPGAGELSIVIGRRESWFEVWGSPDETLNFLGKALNAVIAGRYEEFVKGRKAVGRLALDTGPFLFRDNTLFARWPPRLGRWSHETYEPY
jgi:hypothetical protein